MSVRLHRDDRDDRLGLRLHGDVLAAPGLLDFAVNVWRGGRSPALEEAMRAALRDPGYPDDRAACDALAARHGRSPGEVLALNGGCEAFWLIAHALRPRVAACVHPSFTEPEAALRACGTEVVHVARDPRDWSFDPGSVPDRADLVVLGHPNNPTGALDPPADVLSLLRPDRLVVVDESFMDFVREPAPTLVSEAREGLVVVRSLTKLWGLAGMRAGYLLAQPALVAQLAGQRQPWSVNAVALAALETCARDDETPRRVSVEVAAARAELVEALSGLPGVRVWPGDANFLLLEVLDGDRLVADLRDAGIAVRPADSFPGLGRQHLRVAVRRPHENRLLVQALAEAL